MMLTTHDVGQALMCTQRTAAGWFRRGALPGQQRHPRGPWSISEAALADWLESRRNTRPA